MLHRHPAVESWRDADRRLTNTSWNAVTMSHDLLESAALSLHLEVSTTSVPDSPFDVRF